MCAGHDLRPRNLALAGLNRGMGRIQRLLAAAMMDLIRDMFWAPEAKADPHYWAAVLLAHAAVGAALVAVASYLTRRPVLAVSLAYGLLWEGGQLLLASAGFADSVLDWVAVTLGALAGWWAWQRRRGRVAASLAALLAIMWAGVRGRRR